MMFDTFIKIAVYLFLNIFAKTFANFVDIYVCFMAEIQRVSINASWPCGDVVCTKKLQKTSNNGIWGNFKNITSFSVFNSIQISSARCVGHWHVLSTQSQRISNSVSCPCGMLEMTTLDERTAKSRLGQFSKANNFFIF